MSTCKLILNLDEIADDVNQILDGIDKLINTDEMNVRLNPKTKKILEEIYKKLPDMISLDEFKLNLRYLLDFFSHVGEIQGQFRIEGNYLNVPAIVNDYSLNFSYNYDLYLTCVDFSLSAWKKQDTWSLKIDNIVAFDKVTIKEVGDKKHFKQPYFIKAGSLIQIIFNNNSGNSRQMWGDIHYIKTDSNYLLVKCIDDSNNIVREYYVKITNGIEQTILAPNLDGYTLSGSVSITKIFVENEICIFNYTKEHLWRIKVEMIWEKNSITDLDLYGYYDNKVIYFGHKNEEDIWLDRDIIEHITNNFSEVLTCSKISGYLRIGVNNYNNHILNEDVIFIISKYNNRTGQDVIKKIYVKNKLNKGEIYYVCKIDMETLQIAEINNGDVLSL